MAAPIHSTYSGFQPSCHNHHGNDDDDDDDDDDNHLTTAVQPTLDTVHM
jgi:hypothetical protein